MPSSTDTETADAPVAVDEARSALLEAMEVELGDALVESHLNHGVDLTVRIANGAWTDTGSYLRDRQRFRYFGFLSAIDWLPSPFGRSMDAVVDAKPSSANEGAEAAEGAEAEEDAEEMVSGLAGGDTRFQILARVFSLTTNLGVTLKCDVSDESPSVGSWVATYPGAEWHEREVWEMFGINFVGHPGLRPLYLPGDFEGNPLRKDFPLLARIIKPWPGIVDVEPMPEVESDEAAPPPAPLEVESSDGSES